MMTARKDDECRQERPRLKCYVENTDEFDDGIKDFLRGDHEDNCPYPEDQTGFGKRGDSRRFRWLMGFIWARENPQEAKERYG